jgi:uncharacterized protein YegL
VKPRRGAILVLVALLIPVMAIMAAFAVDVAWMQLVRAELRTATDAASRAGAKELSLEQDTTRARAAAISAASRNRVAGTPLALGAEDVVFGSSAQANTAARFVFTPGGDPISAVRVIGRRQQGSAGGPVALFLGRLMGVNQFEPVQTATSTILDRDLCLVLDRSGSMQGQKIRDLKDAVAAFLDELDDTFPDEQVALASYSTTSRLDETLTKNYRVIRNTVDDFEANGLTAIGLALADGIRGVTGVGRRPFAIPTIVLMTDGNHNTGVEPIVPAREAARQRITVHTVTFGRDADFRRMRDVARATGGEHFHADNGSDLQEVFREIARTLPVLLTD